MSDDAPAVDRYMAEVEALLGADARLSPLAAGILAASHLDIAQDSIAFAKALEVSHALVLREVEMLSSDLHLLEVRKRNIRTQRAFYNLAESAKALFSLPMPMPMPMPL
jgi:hypothetical protein